nr:hypothetical protein [Bordetella pertussis]
MPGESYLAVLDGLHDASIDVTVCRQEGAAGPTPRQLTGCMVTRGPAPPTRWPACTSPSRTPRP